MEIIKYDNREAFLNENLELLLKNEAENELFIGTLQDDTEQENCVLAKITDEKETKVLFMNSEREGLVIYFPERKVNNKTVEFLIENIISMKLNIRQMLVSDKYGEKVLNEYLKKSNKKLVEKNCIDVYQLDEVKEKYLLDGTEGIVKVDSKETNLNKLIKIIKNMYNDIYMGEKCPDDIAKKIANIYLKRGTYILTDEDENIYSYAVKIRKQINSCTIGAVITLSAYLGKGYEKKFLSNLCETLFNEGYKFILLQTNRNNVTAKHIYSGIGFKKVAELNSIYFYD